MSRPCEPYWHLEERIQNLIEANYILKSDLVKAVKLIKDCDAFIGNSIEKRHIDFINMEKKIDKTLKEIDGGRIKTSEEKIKVWESAKYAVNPDERCGAQDVFSQAWDHQQKKIDKLQADLEKVLKLASYLHEVLSEYCAKGMLSLDKLEGANILLDIKQTTKEIEGTNENN